MQIWCDVLLHFSPMRDTILLIQLPQSQENRAKDSPWLAMTRPRPMWINISHGPGSAAGSPQKRLKYERMDMNGWSGWGISGQWNETSPSSLVIGFGCHKQLWCVQRRGWQHPKGVEAESKKRNEQLLEYSTVHCLGSRFLKHNWVRSSVFATLEIKPAKELAAPQLERRWFTPECQNVALNRTNNIYIYIIYIYISYIHTYIYIYINHTYIPIYIYISYIYICVCHSYICVYVYTYIQLYT